MLAGGLSQTVMGERMREGVIRSAGIVAASLIVLVLAQAAFAWAAPAYAAPCGSIVLSCSVERDGVETALAGDSYALTKVASATVDSASGSMSYAVDAAFAALDRDWASLDAAGLRAASREVAVYAEKQGIAPMLTARSDASGRVTFAPLEAGLYLIVRFDSASENRGCACDPLLVSVPTTVASTLDFSVEAVPKFEDGKPEPGPGDSGPSADPESGASNGELGAGGVSGWLAGVLEFAKTSDGMAVVACVAALCAFAAAVALWRYRAGGVRRADHAPGANRPARADGLGKETESIDARCKGAGRGGE